MEQHPIPQQISSYQFRLVGDMTLKQFFQLAGGILVGLLFYASPLLPIIRWPFAIISVILGIALAFLPLEERPLEKWIFAFFRAVYSPTLYSWKKTTTPVNFFQDEDTTNTSQGPQDAAIQTYLAQSSKKVGALENLENAEKSFFSQLTKIFSGAVPQTQTNPQPVATNQVVSTVTQPITPIIPKVENTQTGPVAVSNTQQGIQIPQAMPIKIESEIPKFVVEEKKVDETSVATYQTSQVAPLIAGSEMVSTRAAVFSIDAAPPSPPTAANIVVGQVVDQDKRIIEGAIIEIKDSSGRPIRALKSNKLGHFITVTPMDSGRYEILTDKEGFEFTPVSFDAAGVLIPPILVQGRKVVELETPQNNPLPNNQNANPIAQMTGSQNFQTT